MDLDDESINNELLKLEIPNINPSAKPEEDLFSDDFDKELASLEITDMFLPKKVPLAPQKPIKKPVEFNFRASHWLLFKKITPDLNYQNLVTKQLETKLLNSKFPRTYIHRKISDIIKLKNCVYKYRFVTIIGVYRCSKIDGNFYHYLEEFDTDKTIELNINSLNYYPEQDSEFLCFGYISIKDDLNKENEIIPYISVVILQNLENSEAYEAFMHVSKRYRPVEFDEVQDLENFEPENLQLENQNNTFEEYFTDSIKKEYFKSFSETEKSKYSNYNESEIIDLTEDSVDEMEEVNSENETSENDQLEIIDLTGD